LNKGLEKQDVILKTNARTEKKEMKPKENLKPKKAESKKNKGRTKTLKRRRPDTKPKKKT